MNVFKTIKYLTGRKKEGGNDENGPKRCVGRHLHLRELGLKLFIIIILY